MSSFLHPQQHKKNLPEKRRDQKQKSKTEQSTSLTAVATQTTKAKARHENDFLLLIAVFAVIVCTRFLFFVRLIIQQMLSLVNEKCKKIYSKFNNGEDENLCNVMIFAKRKIDLRGICVA